MPDHLSSLTRDHQTLLEHHRRDPDDDMIWQNLRETRERMERAWLERLLKDG